MTLKEFLNWVGEYWGVFLIFLIFVYWVIFITYQFILNLFDKVKDFVETINENEEYENDYED
jgi:ABC-type glycerol-3-phosphate transport system permease component